MKKILGIVFLSFFLSTSVHSDNIKNFKIENISIGDSALDFFELDINVNVNPVVSFKV